MQLSGFRLRSLSTLLAVAPLWLAVPAGADEVNFDLQAHRGGRGETTE